MKKLSLFFSIVIIVLLVAGCSATKNHGSPYSPQIPTNEPTEIPTPTISPAIANALNILNSSSNLESSLRDLDSSAQSVAESLSALDSASTVLEYSDQLKSIDIPIIGNGWVLFIQAMDASAPGSGAAFVELDTLLREVLAFKDDLNSINSMNDLAEKLEYFKANPNEEALAEVYELIDENLPGLVSIQSKVNSLFSSLDNLLNDIRNVERGLSGAVNSIYPAISGTTSDISSGIEDMLSQAQSLYSSVQEFAAPLNTIIADLQAIRSGSAVGQIVVVPQMPSNNTSSYTAPGPTPSKTLYPTYTPTTYISSTPTPDYMDPIKSISLYWSLVSEKNYEQAWKMLTTGFQNRNHDSQYSDYYNNYVEKNYCSITISNPQIEEQNSNYALVYAKTTFTYGSSCSSTASYDFDYELYLNTNLKLYQIERVKNH